MVYNSRDSDTSNMNMFPLMLPPCLIEFIVSVTLASSTINSARILPTKSGTHFVIPIALYKSVLNGVFLITLFQ